MRAVIVGHGRSADGRGWGDKIDAEDVVVRMWDCDWQNEKDYGRRYDYGFVNAHKAALKAFVETRVLTPQRGWLLYDLGAVSIFPKLEPGMMVVNLNKYFEQAKSMGGSTKGHPLKLTRGAAAALFSLTEWNVDVVLVGFETFRAGRVPKNAYTDSFNTQAVQRYGPGGYREQGFPVGTERTASHDFTVERQLVEQTAQAAGLQVYYSEDIWK